LLDTNVLSEFRKAQSGRADKNVVSWVVTVSPSMMFVSIMSIMELEVGTLLMARRDPAQGALLRTWLDTRILPSFTGRVLSIDAAVAQRCAQLHVPNPQPERDALIAATALVHGMTVVTRNVADFRPSGVPVLNPWDA
jgi:predicted nucleic acid-binding protein